MQRDFHNSTRPWNAQTAKQFAALCEQDAPASPENAGNEPIPAGNLSLGVTLGVHRESGSEVFQFNEDRYRHMLILGRTGAGKSNHIQQMERQDILSGAGCFILAAHEEDALYPLSCVPEERLGDVILIDASNPEYLPRMNPLDVDLNDQAAVDKAIEDVLELLTADCRYEWAGVRFEHYLRNGLRLMMMDPDEGNHCIAALNDLFTDPEYAKRRLKYCTDKRVYDFWTKVFPQAQHSNDSGEVNAWFLSKTARFTTDRTLAHMFGAGKSTLDIQDVIDNGKIFIAYVPENRIGSTAAHTISKWLVMQLRDAVMNRRERDEDGWPGLNYGLYEHAASHRAGPDPFFVYIDEFSKFAGTDFEILLAEARKRHVGLILSTQTLSQTRTYDIKTNRSEQLEEAVIGNVGSLICYPVGTKDAEVLASQFDVDVAKLKCIGRYKPLACLCIDNNIGRPGTLEVELRPEPNNPTAARRVARSHVLSGIWAEVEGANSKGAFFKEVALKTTAVRFEDGRPVSCRPPAANGSEDADNKTAAPARTSNSSFKDAAPDEPCPCGSGRLFRFCHGVSHPDRPRNGLGVAYLCTDPTTGHDRLTGDLTVARLCSEDDYKVVWAFYRAGEADHIATADEYLEELEVRIGERISAGIPDELLDEFDAIQDPAESTRWLEKNRPDFREIVLQVKAEMEGMALAPA